MDRWISVLISLILAGGATMAVAPVGAADVTPESIVRLKMSLNQLVRQQNVQLSRYKSQMDSTVSVELRDSVFALSEVFRECALSVSGLQGRFDAVDATCAAQAPNTPQSIASEASTDLHRCLAEVETGFLGVTLPFDESLSAEIAASAKLNFWLQSKMFAVSSAASPLDTFDVVSATRETFHEAVLWDNVRSIALYQRVGGAPGPLREAGEWGFICGLTAYNKLFQKLKNTESFLNTHCAAV